jgi:hypothetical protein
MAQQATSPPDEELKAAIVALKAENPALGFAKLHALLLTNNPTWTVSEKRAKKVVQGLKAEEAVAKELEDSQPYVDETTGKMYPLSRIMKDLDVSKYSKRIKVEYFGKMKGKGLVATGPIEDTEVIWREDPWIIAPEWCVHENPNDETLR